MKKLLVFVLITCMLCTSTLAFADANASASMQKVLLSVKQKISVPENLSEFTSSTREVGGHMIYYFSWADKEGTDNLSVSCDEKGRISEYHYYSPNDKGSAVFSDITTEEVIAFADDFMKKLVPEVFISDNDTLKLESQNVSTSGSLNYTINYIRIKDGVEVKNSNASVRIYVKDNTPFVRGASISYDYDAKFDSATSLLADPKTSYFEKFPTELVYRDNYSYNAYSGKDDKEIILLYRIKDNMAGYISATDGEEVIEDAELYFGGTAADKNESTNDSMSGGGSGGFTEQEIAELEAVGGLLSKKDIETILKNLPSTDFESTFKLASLRVYGDDKGEYFAQVRYSSDDDKNPRSLNVTLNAKDGKILNLNNYSGISAQGSASLTNKNRADDNVAEFLEYVASDELALCNQEAAEWNGDMYTKSYNRYINGIRYVSNGIYINYDAYKQRVTSYNLNIDSDAEPKEKAEKIAKSDAADAILKHSPLKKIYILSGGSYKLCYALSDFNIEIDAIDGEKISLGYDKEDAAFVYSDMDTHWAKEAVEKLAGINIGLDGDKFMPDEYITQAELLRLFAAGIYYTSYLDYSEDDLYSTLIDRGVITKEEKAADSEITRESAAIFMIRMLDMEKIADISEIFKVSYADQAQISEGKLGYFAILTGLGVLGGDGEGVRPADNITRAETAQMLYKYLKTL